jgi:serine/threonine protein kinase
MGNKNNSLVCPKCYTLNPEESDYCNTCGGALEEKHGTLSYDPEDLPADLKIHFSPGELFGKRYRIIEEVGRGGMGRVYKAEDLELNITVALKIINPRHSQDARFIDRFKKELLSARSISHENVIRIFDIGEEDKIKYISMEFVKGQNLSDLLRTSGPFTPKRAVEITRQICEALNAAHQQGIVHRDLKPSNIMVDVRGQARVMDFGIAKSISRLDPEKPKTIAGTPKYFSPEQSNIEQIDHRSDIYSLGLIIFEMLTGSSAFEAETKEDYLVKHIEEKPPQVSELNPDIPPGLDRIVAKCLEKNKNDRYQSAREILKDLASFEEFPISIPQRPVVKKIWPYILSAAILVIALFSVIIFRNGKKDLALLPAEEMRTSIAIVYFENNTGDESLNYLRRALPNLIIYDLLQSKYIRPLTSDQLIAIHDQLDLADTGQYSTEDLKKISTQGGAENILWASYHKSGDKLRINTLIYKASTWELIDSPFAEGEYETALVDDLTIKIKASLNLSDLLIAEDIDRKVGEITTESPQALNLYFQGMNAYDERKFELSNSYLLEAVELDPKFAMAYRKISLNFGYLRDTLNSKLYLEKAMEHLDRVSDREKYLIEGYHAQTESDCLDDAVKYYRELVRIYPDDIDGNIQLGSVLRNMEEWDEALIRFENVILLEKTNVIGYLNKFYILSAKGFYNEAREFLVTNQHFFPHKVAFHRLMSRLFLNQNEAGLALEEVEKLRDLEPENLDYHIIKGRIHHVQDKLPSALKEYETLIKQDNQDYQINGLLLLSRLYLAQGMLEKAKKAALDGLESARNLQLYAFEVDFLQLLSYLNFRMKSFEDALVAANRSLEIASEIKARAEERFAYIYLGLIYLEMNDLPMAEETAIQLKQLIESSGCKNFIRNYHYLMGMVYQKQGNIPQAVDYFEMAFNSLPYQKSTIDNHALYLDALARVEEMNGDIDKAQDYYEQMTLLTTGKLSWGDLYGMSRYHLGKIYQQKGMNQEALEQYDKFLMLFENADIAKIEREDAEKQIAQLKGEARK